MFESPIRLGRCIGGDSAESEIVVAIEQLPNGTT
jgi:hypothetical protein